MAEKEKKHPLRVVLVEPQIPPNTGNIARLCAATNCELILLGKLGFDLKDSQLKRAGLDYWSYLTWQHIPQQEDFWKEQLIGQSHYLSVHGKKVYTEMQPAWGDCLVFGKETKGLPKELLEKNAKNCYAIPITEPRVRSLNLSSSVAIVLYDALQKVCGDSFAPSSYNR